jgi:RimJ/RimL family protein N-acetyltransferase
MSGGGIDGVVLRGASIRLEPLDGHHADQLVEASGGGGDLYRWSPVPQSIEAARRYIETALAWRAQGRALAFATIDQQSDRVIGSTRFFDITRWSWPAGHERAKPGVVDTCEIGYTWLAPSAVRTAANTEAKLLMLSHAFETWRACSVCFHADARNERSRAALTRLGAQFEGILRSHRLAADHIARDSARFSIVAADWPQVRARLEALLSRPRMA